LILDNGGSKDDDSESHTGILGQIFSSLLGSPSSESAGGGIKSALGVMPAGVYWLWDAAR
jgi:hypothetical protein